MLSLERLDLRDNKLCDPTEIARLTGIPYIREIWVSGNPFTKTHSGYRVVIFNLYRRTPGFSEDIVIDASGPGYSERKQLVDRVAELERAHVVRPIDPEDNIIVDKTAPTIPQISNPSVPERLAEGRSARATVQSEVAVGSGRRRKGHRRRIVDLSIEDASPIKSNIGPEATKPIIKQATLNQLTEAALVEEDLSPQAKSEFGTQNQGGGSVKAAVKAGDTPQPPRLDTSGSSHLLPTIEGIDWNISGDDYRQRLEALKNEVGSGWLAVLGEEAWNGKQKDIGLHHPGSDFTPPSTIRPPPVARANSQVIVTGGRTLG
jgi:hypothetical protein